VGKYTPNMALAGEMAWKPPIVRQLKSVFIYWSRLCNTSSDRINKRIAVWANNYANYACKNWFYNVKTELSKCNLSCYSNIENPVPKRQIVDMADKFFMEKFICEWHQSINSPIGSSRRGFNKLRTYCCFKTEFKVEHYCTLIMPPSHRSALSKFRCGVAPIRLETGRFEKLPESERICPLCNSGEVESESHVLLKCPIYSDIRTELFENMVRAVPNFFDVSFIDQLNFIFTTTHVTRIVAKTCFKILNRRKLILNK